MVEIDLPRGLGLPDVFWGRSLCPSIPHLAAQRPVYAEPSLPPQTRFRASRTGSEGLLTFLGPCSVISHPGSSLILFPFFPRYFVCLPGREELKNRKLESFVKLNVSSFLKLRLGGRENQYLLQPKSQNLLSARKPPYPFSLGWLV